jgi:uncharacterized protein (TIGR02466 family)
MGQDGNPLFETSEVIPMFPTLVWKMQLPAAFHAPLNARLVALLADMRGEAPPLPAGQGWQSATSLHEREELRELVGCIHKAAGGILRFLRIGQSAIEVTGCWATVLAPGAGHRAHHHPNNYLSGAYYLRTPSAADAINFHDPRAQTGIIRPPVLELSAENTDQVVVRVNEGTLLLFPSYLEHSVDPNPSTEERISLSFNLMFTAFTESMSKPLW